MPFLIFSAWKIEIHKVEELKDVAFPSRRDMGSLGMTDHYGTVVMPSEAVTEINDGFLPGKKSDIFIWVLYKGIFTFHFTHIIVVFL